MTFTRKIAYVAGLAAVLSCSESPTEPPKPNTNPPTQQQPQQQNRPPVINSLCPSKIDENSFYRCTINATDADGDILNYKIQGPDWLSVSNNVIFGNVPDVSEDSTFPLKIIVSDNKTTTVQTYNLTVNNLSNSYLISPTAENPLIDVEENSLTFQNPTGYNVGDILVADTSQITPYGALREITSISSDRKTTNTKQATLDKIITDETFSVTGTLSSSNTQPFQSLRQGVSLSPSLATQPQGFGLNLNNVVLYDHDGNPLTTDDQLIANGRIEFGTDFDLNADFGKFKLKNFDFKNQTTISSDITLGSNMIGFALKLEVPLGESYFSPIVVPVGGFPVVVVPKVGFYVGIDPTHVNPLSVRVRQESSLETILSYDNVWLSDSNFSNNFEFSNPEFGGEWDLSVYATPRFTLLFGGVLGTSAGVSADLRLESSGLGDWKLYGGLAAGVGVSMEIFSKTIASYYKDLIDFEKLLAEDTTQVDTTSIPPSPDMLVDPRDGKNYRTIAIGTQVWMADNLDYNAIGSEAYENNLSYEDVYGRLYPWNSSKTACPIDWHLPTEGEWKNLSDYLGGSEVSGGKLKSTGTIESGTGLWYSPNSGATNESGFNAHPGGMKEIGTFSRIGERAYFWISDDIYADSKWLNFSSEGLNIFGSQNIYDFKFSIRCVRD